MTVAHLKRAYPMWTRAQCMAVVRQVPPRGLQRLNRQINYARTLGKLNKKSAA